MKSFDYEPIQPETTTLPEALALEVTAENEYEEVDFDNYTLPAPAQSFLLFAYIYKKVGECFYKMLTYKVENVEATEAEAIAQAQREYDSLARWQYKRVCLIPNFSITKPHLFLQETI